MSGWKPGKTQIIILAWIRYLGVHYWYKDQDFVKSKPVALLFLAGVMATLLNSESRRLYSWWWDSHISPKNSKWLQDNLTGLHSLPGSFSYNLNNVCLIHMLGVEEIILECSFFCFILYILKSTKLLLIEEKKIQLS